MEHSNDKRSESGGLTSVAKQVCTMLDNSDTRLSIVDSEHLMDTGTGVMFHFYRNNRMPFKISKDDVVLVAESDLADDEYIAFNDLMAKFISEYKVHSEKSRGELMGIYNA